MSEAHIIRHAGPGDIARIMEIRHAVTENRLSRPDKVTAADCARFMDRAPIWVWDEAGIVQGFSAGDPANGFIWALFVDPAAEGRGIGRALLPRACESLRAAGYEVATLQTGAGTRAERFYIRDGWMADGTTGDGEIIFAKPL
jgi:GNAT superfamily N-acetyltransferase